MEEVVIVGAGDLESQIQQGNIDKSIGWHCICAMHFFFPGGTYSTYWYLGNNRKLFCGLFALIFVWPTLWTIHANFWNPPRKHNGTPLREKLISVSKFYQFT